MILFYSVVGLGGATFLVLLGSARISTILLIPLVVTLLVAVVATSSIMLPEFTGAPWVPTSRELVSKILSMSELKPTELLYDLGSGDGRIVVAAAKDFGARSVGIEIDPFRVLYSRLKIFQLRLKNAKIVRSNFFDVDLRDADVVVLFLLQDTNDKLQRKLERELSKPNCRVVSLVFHFKGWEVIRADEEEMIYIYKPHPAKVFSSKP